MKDIVLLTNSNIVIGLFAYLLIVNLVGFMVYGIDKKKAVNHQWRIPESTLILIAFWGGAVGCLGGMVYFHHKTKKTKFYIGVPAILVFHIILFIVGVLLIL